MEIRVNDTAPVNQTTGTTPVDTGDGSFKFTLTSAIEEQELQQRLNSLLDDITKQGNLIAAYGHPGHEEIPRTGEGFLK